LIEMGHNNLGVVRGAGLTGRSSLMVQAAPIQVVTTALQARSELLSKIQASAF
jgi:hypothetical protein